MPPEASLEQEEKLIVMLSVGEAAIALLDAQKACARPDAPGYADRDLERAFADLAAGRITDARDLFSRFAANGNRRSLPEAEHQTNLAVQATIIAEALQLHERLFQE